MNDELLQLATELGAGLKARAWKAATAESCTGGGVACAMTEVAGSSEWFERGFVTYSNESKQELLGVRGTTLQALGAVSEATVLEMAQGALRVSPAHVAVAISGIAGPSGGSEAKPVGTVCFAWATRAGARTETCWFKGDRAAVRAQACAYALRGLLALCASAEATE